MNATPNRVLRLTPEQQKLVMDVFIWIRRVVIRIWRKWNKVIEFEELQGEAYAAVCYAATCWDPEKGRNWQSWCSFVTKQRLHWYHVRKIRPWHSRHVVAIANIVEEIDLNWAIDEGADSQEAPEQSGNAELVAIAEKVLSEKYWAALYRRYVNHESLREIADEEGISHQGVADRINKAIFKLWGVIENPYD